MACTWVICNVLKKFYLLEGESAEEAYIFGVKRP